MYFQSTTRAVVTALLLIPVCLFGQITVSPPSGAGVSSADGKSAILTEIDVAAYATGGSGTSGSPYTGWDSAITWAAETVYRFRDNKYYSFSTTLDLSYTGLQLKGKGILKWTGSTGGSTKCIQLLKTGSSNASYAWNVRLEDFTLDTNGAFCGIYVQGVHHNTFSHVVITNSHASSVTTHAIQMKFSVLGVIDHLRVTQNEAAFGSAAGITNGVTFDTDGINGPATAYTLINPTIEGVTGNALNLANCSYVNVQGGSSENSTSFGIVSGNRTGISIGSSSFSNTFTGVDLESNSVDLDISGRNNTFTSLTSSDVVNLNSTAKANTFIGGRYNSIAVNASAIGSTFLNFSYGYQGGTIVDTSPTSLWVNVDNDSFGVNGTATLGFGNPANGNAGIYSNAAYTVVNSKGASPLYLNFDNSNAGATVNLFAGNAVFTQAGKLTLAGGLSGTTTNDSASAGNVGEYVSSLVAIGSPQSLSNGTAANVTSISLTAGDWDVEGNVNFTETTSTVTARSAGISTTSATVPTDGSEAYCGVQSTVTSETNSITLPRKRISIASTTTVYLVGRASFSAGTCGGFGQISARRVR